MPSFSSETELLEALSAHEDLVRKCARGDIEFAEFVHLYDDFWWRYALDGHESGCAEQLLLERHAHRILIHQKIAVEVLGALASEGDVRNQSYERAGRIGVQDALVRLRSIAAEFLGE